MNPSRPTPAPSRRTAPATTDEAERRHFVFASILVLSCMLALPVAGVAYILMIRAGWLASPW